VALLLASNESMALLFLMLVVLLVPGNLVPGMFKVLLRHLRGKMTSKVILIKH